MKGPFPGQVLTAVGIDPNNGTYPLAYGIVEAESYASWSWFLQNLGEDLDLYVNSNFTFISDRQKGILPAIAKLFPCAEHRFCLRHIHENMKQQWNGKAYKDHLWKCETATTVPQFQSAIEELKNFNQDCYAWLNQIPPQHWSRSHFTGRCHSDVLLNNMCEVFNKQIVEARDKPIISALEYIRHYLMKRIVHVLKVIEKCEGQLTPTATKTMEKIKHEATQYRVIWNGGNKYEVYGPWNDQVIVDVYARSCSCRRWELTGIPCKHVVATNWNMALNGANVDLPEKWVDRAYWIETWKTMYMFKVEPINGKAYWPTYDCPTKLIAPTYHKQIGRPKKKRKKCNNPY
ncbi:hypothetical protein L6452_28367 [Arctium lappa]|uniref:Uncharacterized protein n=1 Tax=Arctium lappa TaxID=4217 RepID=A0ACB8ZY36_ARCLA|nr:hypothetical protein L6452_28367 [Arctium lappa]